MNLNSTSSKGSVTQTKTDMVTTAYKTKTNEESNHSSIGDISSYVELRHKERYELSISDEAIVKAIDKANKSINGVQKKFEYSVHKKSGDIVVKVINAETNEVIREVPPEKFLDLIDKLQEISGTIFDERR
ncbi:flagellar protein FlaG [Paenibacillus sp. V4I3]|uniref:flagellar protein FlaG n=1 Tax=Paenibacillus sp. V4I3 TaxID=3042305 RepID=UPI00277F4455|nr:flagellar protein FlaG [Paenibacillus sp. V4I3]MDQ0872143.1 flagellar protein FlaG [Paenibacillus sp. V4I3]